MKRFGIVISIISLALFITSIIFQWLQIPGASILLIIGVILGALFLLSIINRAVKLPSSNSARSFLMLGAALFLIISLSIPFNVQDWPYAKTLMILSYVSQVALVVLLISDAWLEKDNGRRLKKALLAYGVGFLALLVLYLS